ncbi:MAG: tetratricopeptide repeat protein [Methylococcales bacterium]|nr:tetratricopeptide repeat protein [Methylococcales bacterium]MDG2364695.1 tetratricopeptide repeat protein [Methylococcaceae bacterium]MBT3699154.1 tetratricopeptide repeat protein [Methylococcales bacterium]MBT3816140.1 tetratricopeptide repeat protein [Methylococcales bacterium]MBT4032677.1 tetratricopeptide repeat protein [Methylococcales bacterium]
MEIYETEEEQVEALKRWWKANGASVISGIVLAVVIILSWKYWENYQADLTIEASNLYGELLSAQKEGKTESALKIADRLVQQYETTPYAEFSVLFQAKIKVDNNDYDAAKVFLKKLVASAAGEINHIARIRLIRLFLATEDYDTGLQLIAEVNPTQAESFEGIYQELTGDLYVALDRRGEARTAYQNAVRKGRNTPLMQLKINDLTISEIIEIKE